MSVFIKILLALLHWSNNFVKAEFTYSKNNISKNYLETLLTKLESDILVVEGVAKANILLLLVKDNQTLTEYHNSENFYMEWEIFYNTVMIADGLVGGYQGITSLPQLYQKIRTLKYLKNAGKLLKPEFYSLLMSRLLNGSSNDLVNAFKPGYSKESILAIPKGSRPDPSIYLKQKYIDAHLAKFPQEGGGVPHFTGVKVKL